MNSGCLVKVNFNSLKQKLPTLFQFLDRIYILRSRSRKQARNIGPQCCGSRTVGVGGQEQKGRNMRTGELNDRSNGSSRCSSLLTTKLMYLVEPPWEPKLLLYIIWDFERESSVSPTSSIHYPAKLYRCFGWMFVFLPSLRLYYTRDDILSSEETGSRTN